MSRRRSLLEHVPILLACVLCVGRADAQAQGTPPPAPGASTIYFDADAESATLEVREVMVWKGRNEGWRPVCASPCAIPALAGYEFRAAAPGKLPSAPFTAPWAGATGVHGTMGSRSARATGIVLTSLGGAAAGIGFTFALLMAGGSSEFDRSPDDALVAAGVGLLGTAALTTGLYLILSNRTSVTMSPAPPQGFALTPAGFVF
jgi:hypothetical protein